MIEITRRSPISGDFHTMTLDATSDQLALFASGAKVQDAFPQLPAEEREFILTGISPAEWDAMFAGSNAVEVDFAE
jgi:hypothetical protein